MNAGQIEKLKALALAAEKGGQHIYTNPRDSNKWKDNEAWQQAASPEAFSELIAEVERLRADPLYSTRQDADRFRRAIALEDSAEALYAAVLSHAPDGVAIRAAFDAENAATGSVIPPTRGTGVDLDALVLEYGNAPVTGPGRTRRIVMRDIYHAAGEIFGACESELAAGAARQGGGTSENMVVDKSAKNDAKTAETRMDSGFDGGGQIADPAAGTTVLSDLCATALCASPEKKDQALKMAIRALEEIAIIEAEAEKDAGWISVSERQPDDSLLRFLVTGRAINGGPLGVHMATLHEGSLYFDGARDNGGCNPCIDDVVTHWMPLPAAPVGTHTKAGTEPV